MSSKTNVVIDKILRGVFINKNNEVDYTANIIVELEKDVPFEYAVVDEGTEEQPFVPFSSAKKFVIIKHKNTNGVFRKKILLLKSNDRTDATVSIELDRLIATPAIAETLGPRGTVLLRQGENDAPGQQKKEWYKDPWILGAIVVVVLLVVMVMSGNKKRNNDGYF
jgi:hypothetical protein